MHNTGLYNIAGALGIHLAVLVPYQTTRERQDIGKFKAPTRGTSRSRRRTYTTAAPRRSTMDSLTDEALVHDARFADPWGQGAWRQAVPLNQHQNQNFAASCTTRGSS